MANQDHVVDRSALDQTNDILDMCVQPDVRTGGLVDLYGPNDAIALRSIGVAVPVAALYRRTDVPLLAKKRRPQEAEMQTAEGEGSAVTPEA